MNIIKAIANIIEVNEAQVFAAVKLLDEGSTVPFISRYRKEATGGLTDGQLRDLEEKLQYFRELEDRRATILNSIKEQGKLTPELEKAILATDNKATLEDLYLPYKPKRRTKAQIAREAGLEPLAFGLLESPKENPETFAEKFINEEKGITNIAEALEGARQILMEHFAENAELLGFLRDYLWEHGIVESKVAKDKDKEGANFSDYFDFKETVKTIPSHRALAIFRGRNENILHVSVKLEENEEEICKNKIASHFNVANLGRLADKWLLETVNYAWKIKIYTKLELDLMSTLRDLAEDEAIRVFANNLKHLLMAAPAGTRATMGLDPGFRTGVKVVVVDATGKLLEHLVIFPHAPQNKWDESIAILAALCLKHKVELISIGNGTASRETDKLAAEVMKKYPDLKVTKIMVSEAGASVYSASKVAEEEFPKLDVSYRGAVSIARRLQDPLAELVKIDPKSIGVGQYQHDVNQSKLGKVLKGVMEDCVNAVGVDVNTASVPLLASVAGLNETLAKNIIAFRNEKGAYKNRKTLKEVPRMGEKAFEQAAGFLRVVNGDNPLDASAVHPESYPVVERILLKQHKSLKEIMGNREALVALNAKDFVDDKFGMPTVTDIIKELEKPGRDPRPEFKMATFKDDVTTAADLKPNMILEGVVTNVANFGAFVDIGVHQDGLVHVSMLANKFVKDPNEIVKVGDIVKVKVLEVDLVRKRISLSMKLDETAIPNKSKDFSSVKKDNKKIKKGAEANKTNSFKDKTPVGNSILADALKNAFSKT